MPDLEAAIWVGDLIVAAVVAWIFSLWSRTRFVRNDILPRLVAALHSLKPTREEIAAVLRDMKALGLRIGSRINPDMVMAELQSHVPAKAA